MVALFPAISMLQTAKDKAKQWRRIQTMQTHTHAGIGRHHKKTKRVIDLKGAHH
jgi:hypothetical protein